MYIGRLNSWCSGEQSAASGLPLLSAAAPSSGTKRGLGDADEEYAFTLRLTIHFSASECNFTASHSEKAVKKTRTNLQKA